MEVTVFERMPPLEVVEAWRSLAVAAENPFALPEWHESWCESYPQDTSRIVVCRREDGDVAGVLSLVSRGAGRRQTVLAPGDHFADFFAPACAPIDSAAVAAAVLRERAQAHRGWELWRLERCLAGSAWLNALAAAAPSSGFAVLPWRPEPPLVVADLTADAVMDGRQRRELGRLRRRLEADHTVAVRSSAGPEEAVRDLEVLLRLHAARWGSDAFGPTVRAFHRAFARRAAENGWLRLHTLEVDGMPAAALYGWRLNTRAFAYSQAFDPAFARHAVGISLLASAVELATAEGCACFDMLRGDERHKLRFRTGGHELQSHLVVRRRSPAVLEALARSSARRAWARLPRRGRALVRRLSPR